MITKPIAIANQAVFDRMYRKFGELDTSGSWIGLSSPRSQTFVRPLYH